MTIEQSMLSRAVARLMLLALVLCGCCAIAGGCAGKPKDQLVAPKPVLAPYNTARGDVLWAIVPLRNESGTSLIDVLEVSDQVAAAAAQVKGIRVVPVNRTIAAMRALKMSELTSPMEAKRLASELGADGLLVGSITAWDPYRPTVGLALALYARDGALSQLSGDAVDVERLRFAPTDYQYFPRSAFADAPASVVSEYLDGKNHQVLMDVQQYATGRHDPNTALGWRRYTASMPLFTEFAAWHTVGRLIEHEWIRLARVPRPKP